MVFRGTRHVPRQRTASQEVKLHRRMHLKSWERRKVCWSTILAGRSLTTTPVAVGEKPHNSLPCMRHGDKPCHRHPGIPRFQSWEVSIWVRLPAGVSIWGCSSSGRAAVSKTACCMFESCYPCHNKKSRPRIRGGFLFQRVYRQKN